jgi:hypothetical protein
LLPLLLLCIALEHEHEKKYNNMKRRKIIWDLIERQMKIRVKTGKPKM